MMVLIRESDLIWREMTLIQYQVSIAAQSLTGTLDWIHWRADETVWVKIHDVIRAHEVIGIGIDHENLILSGLVV